MKHKMIFFLFPLLMTGCVEKEILDDVNIVTVIGYDMENSDQVKGTVVIPVYKQDAPVESEIIEASSPSEVSKDILTRLQRKASDPLVLGKISVAVYSEEIAKKGLTSLVDTLQRDASVGERIYLTVGRESANTILQGQYGYRGTAAYISNLIKHNIESADIPQTNLHIFLYDLYAKDSDPYLPILKKDKSNIIEIDGLALFKGDRMVSEIGNDKLIFFKLISDKYTEGTYSLKLPENEQVAIKTITSNRKIEVNKKDPTKLKIKVKLSGFVQQYTGKIITPKIKKEMEKAFEKVIVNESKQMIEQFKELDIDPLGLEDIMESHIRGFSKKDWDETYPNLSVDIIPEVEINETGVIE
ncbi:Ger(x)C family spore germination protein [Metabacillus idriensis]|uniref:Ger(x)C family spore germination protein n=1 Tax=Metabacillus idriensis TaxID=324768 RepID=UPI00174DE365|nr:Ger(x)C family spore germination protein [Metabacillus idriensis]